MSDNHKEAIQIYTSGISNLITITTAGLAASTALMQIAGFDASNKWFYLWSLVVFFVGLIFCFLTMSGLTGQAKSLKPNIDVANIKCPALISFGAACVGFFLMGFGAFTVPDKKEVVVSAPTFLKIELCRMNFSYSIEKKILCYDSFIDDHFRAYNVTIIDLKNNFDKNQAWINEFILDFKK